MLIYNSAIWDEFIEHQSTISNSYLALFWFNKGADLMDILVGLVDR